MRLTKAQWLEVFALRCRSKRGLPLSGAEQELVNVAYRQNPKRYGAMEPEIFNATVPFGSSARWKV